MKLIILALLMPFIMPYSIVWPMWFGWNTPQPFNADVALKISDNYHKLQAYLESFIDTPQASDDLSSSWHGAKVTVSQSNVFSFIEKQAYEGNVVCLYFFVRNTLKYCTIESQRTLKQTCLAMMMLLLMRVAYDIGIHYTFFKDASVFNAYTILKQKMHYLLSHYAPKLSYDDNTDLEATINQALMYWQLNFSTMQNSFSCTWLRSFDWAHAWTPGSRGIYFGPDNLDDARTIQMIERNPGKNVFTVISTIFNTEGKLQSWEKFFQNFNFPLNEMQLSAAHTQSLYTYSEKS